MPGQIRYTTHFNFAKPPFNYVAWHDMMNDNFDRLDTMLSIAGYPVFEDVWANDTLYEVGDRAFDDTNSTVFVCMVEHTSAASGTFPQERANNPTYWVLLDQGITYRAAWTTGAVYYYGDIVTNNGSSYMCVEQHTAGVSFAGDFSLGYWDLFAEKGAAGAGTGDVIGPSSVTDGRIAVYSGTTGKLLGEGANTIAELATLASPTFTGVPAAPTAAGGTNTTQLATTAFVIAAINALIDASPGTLDTLNEIAAALGDDPNFAATMTTQLALKAPLASPALTGTPTAPTQTAGNNTTRLATTAFVTAAVAALLTTADQTITGGARVTSASLGTITSGIVTLDPGDRPLQHYTNNGAHTLQPGSNAGSIILDITNGASAGAITVSGWTKVVGAFTTTNGHKFRCSATVGNGGSLLSIQPLQ